MSAKELRRWKIDSARIIKEARKRAALEQLDSSQTP
jgi:hypothetical protein